MGSRRTPESSSHPVVGHTPRLAPTSTTLVEGGVGGEGTSRGSVQRKGVVGLVGERVLVPIATGAEVQHK